VRLVTNEPLLAPDDEHAIDDFDVEIVGLQAGHLKRHACAVVAVGYFGGQQSPARGPADDVVWHRKKAVKALKNRAGGSTFQHRKRRHRASTEGSTVSTAHSMTLASLPGPSGDC